MRVVVVTGVSGSGKSRVGALLAERLGVAFQEGDDLHPAANIAKMKSGHPLDDADRAPWLDRVAAWIAARDHGVISCSALKRRYRDRLRQDSSPAFVLLNPPTAVLTRRLARRQGHFMPATLLDSQLAALERPDPDEHVLTVTADEAPEAIAAAIARWLV